MLMLVCLNLFDPFWFLGDLESLERVILMLMLRKFNAQTDVLMHRLMH